MRDDETRPGLPSGLEEFVPIADDPKQSKSSGHTAPPSVGTHS
jgi:hypothetical protein